MVSLELLIARIEKELKSCAEIWPKDQWSSRYFVENLTLPEAELILEALQAQIRDKVYLVIKGLPDAAARTVLRVAKTPVAAMKAKKEEIERLCANFASAEEWYNKNVVIEAMELEN